MKPSEYQTILNTKFKSSDLNKTLTIRAYLIELLKTLWREGEGFSGKRPFGNGGWQYDIYRVLIQAGHIKGKFDEDGYIEEIDEAKADRFMIKLIGEM